MKKLFIIIVLFIIGFTGFAEDLDVPIFMSINVSDRWAEEVFKEEMLKIMNRSYFSPAPTIDTSALHFIVNGMEVKNNSGYSTGYAFAFAVIFHGAEAVYFSNITTGVTGSGEMDIRWVAKEGYKYLVGMFENTVSILTSK